MWATIAHPATVGINQSPKSMQIPRGTLVEHWEIPITVVGKWPPLKGADSPMGCTLEWRATQSLLVGKFRVPLYILHFKTFYLLSLLKSAWTADGGLRHTFRDVGSCSPLYCELCDKHKSSATLLVNQLLQSQQKLLTQLPLKCSPILL